MLKESKWGPNRPLSVCTGKTAPHLRDHVQHQVTLCRNIAAAVGYIALWKSSACAGGKKRKAGASIFLHKHRSKSIPASASILSIFRVDPPTSYPPSAAPIKLHPAQSSKGPAIRSNKQLLLFLVCQLLFG